MNVENDRLDSDVDGEQYPEDVLVSPEWVHNRLGRLGSTDPEYRLVEVDVNSDFYYQLHVPGAVGLDWRADLRAESKRDIIGPTRLEEVLGNAGITEDTTIIAYGDNSNWFATHFYWMMRYYDHPDVRIMDGGRSYWKEHGYPMEDRIPSPEPVEYTVQGRAAAIRARREDVRTAIDEPVQLIDVRSREEYIGEITAPPGSRESAQRAGHIPGAHNVFWARNIRPDRRFKARAQLEAVYRDRGLRPEDEIITYCRIGERSAVTWFVLHELLEYENVANYDGSWVEWGNMINAPIATGE
jgi:thiosulfate/3-mercaptopyruvate sulfurtransferase